MLRILIYATLTILVTATAIWFAQNPADIEINWLGYQVKTSLIVILLCFFLLCIVAKLCCLPFKLFSYLDDMREKREQQHKDKLMIEFLTAIGTDNTSRYASLGKRIDKSFASTPELRDLMLLNVSSGDTKTEILENLSIGKDTKLLALKAQIEQAENDDKKTEALELYKEAFEKYPKTPSIATKYISLLALFGRFEEVKDIAKKAYNKKIISKEEYKRLVSSAILEEGLTSGNDSFIIKAAEIDNTNAAAVMNAAKSLVKAGRKHKAFTMLETLWLTHPCLDVYSTASYVISSEKPLARLKKMEKFIKSNKSTPLKDVLLADIYAKAGLWGQAKALAARYEGQYGSSALLLKIKASIAAEENPDSAEVKTLRDIAAHSPLPCEWVCSNCKGTFAEWHAVCPECHTFGNIDTSLNVQDNA